MSLFRFGIKTSSMASRTLRNPRFSIQGLILKRQLLTPKKPTSQRLLQSKLSPIIISARTYTSDKPPSQPSASAAPPNSSTPNPPIPPSKKQIQQRIKNEILRSTTSRVERVKIRFRWLLKKSHLPFNSDDYSAIFSWLFIGNLALFILGTTTFVSLVLLTVNTVFAQTFLAEKVGNFITQNTGLTVYFENAIVPDWRDGKLVFTRCFVSKRPKGSKRFSKKSQAVAMADALDDNPSKVEDKSTEPVDDGNYTQFDLTIEEVQLSLSFKKWMNGKGIIENLTVKGVRGVVDRTHVFWNEGDSATNYKNIHRPGDWEIEDFKLEDVMVKLMQPNGFRHFNFSIFNCHLAVLRKNWLFYDFLNANNMSGSYDDSLFTIHKRQRIDDYGASFLGLNGGVEVLDDSNKRLPWKRVTRLRVDGLNVDHLNTGLEGPFGWITKGDVDMVGDVMVPEEEGDFNVGELVQLITQSISKQTRKKNTESLNANLSKYFVMDLKVRLNNVRATVPLFTDELSYVNNALIRPIVGYINSRKTYIPIECRIVKNINDFDGSWTIYDSLLMDDMQAEVYDAFERYVADERVRSERAKKIGFWSLQFLFQLLLLSLGTIA